MYPRSGHVDVTYLYRQVHGMNLRFISSDVRYVTFSDNGHFSKFWEHCSNGKRLNIGEHIISAIKSIPADFFIHENSYAIKARKKVKVLINDYKMGGYTPIKLSLKYLATKQGDRHNHIFW